MGVRVKHVDIAKGISITLVAMFHTKLRIFVPDIVDPLSLFRLPLFFFLSGIFFSWAAAPGAFVSHKFEALLKPYLVVLLSLFLLGFISGEDDLTERFVGIFYGVGDTIEWIPMWFLPHLFAVFLFTYGLFRWLKFSDWSIGAKALFLLLLLGVGSEFIDAFWYREVNLLGDGYQLPGLPFSIDIVLITSVFFLFGYMMRDQVVNFKPNIWLFLLAVVVFLIIETLTDARIMLNKRQYDFPLYATIGAVCGGYVVITFSWLISKSEWLSIIPLRLGEASLFILIFHNIINTLFYGYFSEGIVDVQLLTGIAFLCFGLSIFIPLLIRWVVVKSDLLALLFLPAKVR
ncbi:MAG: acyltransferase family protein [Candidatus Thiodiazotropha taylori]|nr:acyltransferase family protein [Candidatus Thiodiazotropha taylori]